MRPIGLIAISCVALALSGCITTMDVQKVKSAQQLGIQYSLPVPILQVCPGPAGTIAVQEIYLPDQDNRYGISAKTYAAKFNLNVELTKEGFLKKLNWNPDSTAVAEKVAESAGNIAKAKIEADAKAAEEVAKKEAEAAKTRKDALATAEKAVNDAEADLRVAAATLAALRTQPNATPAQIVEAEVNVAKARAKLENALEAQSRLIEQLGLAATSSPSSGNESLPAVAGTPSPTTPAAAPQAVAATPPATAPVAPQAATPTSDNPAAPANAAGEDIGSSAASSASDDLPEAFGCVLYQIVETEASLTLKPVERQKKFKTSLKFSPPKEQTLKPELRIRPETSQVVRPRGRHRELVLHVMSSLPLKEFKLVALETLPDREDVTKRFPPAITLSGSGFRVDLHDGTPTGRYRLSVALTASGIKDPAALDLEFEVRR